LIGPRVVNPINDRESEVSSYDMPDSFQEKLERAQVLAAQLIYADSPIPMEAAVVLSRDPAITRTPEEVDRVVKYLRRAASHPGGRLSPAVRAFFTLDQSRLVQLAAQLRMLCFP
ncbi:hypothetical protein FOZ62_020991, partial [Perkinsus olseni]